MKRVCHAQTSLVQVVEADAKGHGQPSLQLDQQPTQQVTHQPTQEVAELAREMKASFLSYFSSPAFQHPAANLSVLLPAQLEHLLDLLQRKFIPSIQGVIKKNHQHELLAQLPVNFLEEVIKDLPADVLAKMYFTLKIRQPLQQGRAVQGISNQVSFLVVSLVAERSYTLSSSIPTFE